ncbi:MAG: YigZ family protein [Gammaproteobacteria bacterium]|nr:YigZ family protein [Gammaproteobacteria bacterium]
MSNKNYVVPAETLEKTLLVKKSRFIACATIVSSRDDAKDFLQIKKIEYPDARHHCWAYLIGNPSSASNAAMNDDGEPSGTAGKPILNVIQHKKIGDVMVLVTRYFGGIKLGAGGLTRAYSGATELVLSELKLIQQIFMSEYLLSCDFSQEQMMHHWVGQHEATLEVLQYSNQVELKIKLPQVNNKLFEQFCLANGVFDYKLID